MDGRFLKGERTARIRRVSISSVYKPLPLMNLFYKHSLNICSMKPIAIECAWGSIHPTVFSREILIRVPYYISFANDRACAPIESNILTFKNHRTLNGEESSNILVKDGEIDVSGIYELMKRTFPFGDLSMIRLRGECLTNDGFEFTKSLAEEIMDEDGEFQIIVETSLRPAGSWERLNDLMKRNCIDHACIYIDVPGEDVDGIALMKNIEIAVNGLTGCIMSIRRDNLRSVNLCLVIGENSSMSHAEKILSEIKNACMNDDYYKGMEGIAMFSFSVTLLPMMDTPYVNDFVSTLVGQMYVNFFDDNKTMVVPPSLSRVSEWIDR